MTLLYDSDSLKKPKIKVTGSRRPSSDVKNGNSIASNNPPKKSNILLKSSESKILESPGMWRTKKTGNEDPNIRLKLMSLLPKNNSTKTSEGVQDFIKHMSVYLEQKIPFTGRRKGSQSSLFQDQRTVRGVAIKTQVKAETWTSRKDEKTAQQTTTNRSYMVERTYVHPQVSPSKSSNTKKTLTATSTGPGPKDKVPKTRDNKADINQSETGLNKQKLHGGRKTQRSDEDTSKIRQTFAKGSKPSEIPLRKPRQEATAATSAESQTISLLLQKPVSEAESSLSVDMCKMMSSTLEATLLEETPSDQEEEVKCIEPTSCESYHVGINAYNGLEWHLEDKFSVDVGKNKQEKEEKKEQVEQVKTEEVTTQPEVKKPENNETDIELKESSKVSNFPLAYNDNPSTATAPTASISKAKMLDLDKIKSSNISEFTSSETLQKLESLHQQNSSSTTKLKALSSKTSFSSINGNTSRITRPATRESKMSLKSRLKEDSSRQSLPETPNRERVRGPAEPSADEKRKRNSTPTTRQSDIAFKVSNSQCEKPPTGRDRIVKSAIVLADEPNEKPSVLWFGKKADECSPSNQNHNSDNSGQIREPLANPLSSVIPLPYGTTVPSTTCLQAITHASPETEATTSKNITSEGKIPAPPTPPPTPEMVSRARKSNSNNHHSNSNKPKPPASTVGKRTSSWRLDGRLKPKHAAKLENLVIRGTRIDLTGKEEVEVKDDDSEKLKLEITIDLKNSDELPEQPEQPEQIEQPKLPLEEGQNQDLRYIAPESEEEKKMFGGRDMNADSIFGEEVEEDWNRLNSGHSPFGTPEVDDNSADGIRLKVYKSSSSIKRKPKYKSSITRMKVRPKKKKTIKPEAGSHSYLASPGQFNSVTSFKSKTKKLKADAKVRSGLTRALNQEGLIDGDLNYLFDDAAAMSLRRRNSEPNSFRGFIWKQPELAVFRGNKASVSSMASSLRHMNADELEDFRVWEAAPLKMTSCWEMSLYHCRRPWSVLSCSVFKDNRMANAPGIILENLRNGGTLDISGSLFCDKDRMGTQGPNAFDVEPSVAQKNIDIRNWLSALNFPTPPTTSNDAILEGNFCGAGVPAGTPMNQATPKRRKTLRTVNYSEETLKKKFEDNRNTEKPSELMDLIRRKSGGFVTVDRSDPFSSAGHPEYLITYPDQNPTKNAAHDLGALKTKGDGPFMSADSQWDSSMPETCLDEDKTKFLSEDSAVDVPLKQETKSRSGFWGGVVGFLKGETDVNIWKYLFILSLSLILYNYLNANMVAITTAFTS